MNIKIYKSRKWFAYFAFATLMVTTSSFSPKSSAEILPLNIAVPVEGGENIPVNLKWSERMALSTVKRNAWLQDVNKNPGWGYTQGLIVYSFEQIWKKNQDKKYLDYVKTYGTQMIQPDGTIKTYQPETYNIDNINAGKSLFTLYKVTGEEKYKKALQQLRNQMKTHPRTSEGGFFHKQKYPSQLWLDGAYMASPFLAQYAQVFNEPQLFDDVAQQLILMEKHLRDAKTGLLYHGWDEKRVQPWADPETGRSRNFWGRAIGWYAMALVDVLDYLPQSHPKRKELLTIWQRLVPALQKYQDTETGLWYQVVDQGNRAGNYLEASGSCMFVYAIAKSVNKGYLEAKYKPIAQKGFKGIIEKLVEVKPDGEINLLQVCEVAGLSDDRNGSFAYYVKEPIRINDPKGVGPFILASLELNK
ncbi:family 88 glycosyl hydrolase [Adhaeribacter aerolatus]|uniref:Family 88 glycosyl hydrolase n=1 Tax=Adhaeribacter aerolatus TaxID=670289 RepID=A0A512AXG9_9BACT|nr:glycoside hydrolase family 88 protein [Adhaeribacter aerolatus]GEO04416.1 family 88 glycosyl hydrolase [Adhaeribacter aerolatus]